MALSTSIQQAMESWEPSTIDCPRRPIPLVVHNGLQDLLFLLTHFYANILPDTWPECKACIHSFFPIIYDTKLMANEYCAREVFQGRTHLAAVYDRVMSKHPQWNRIFAAEGNPQNQEQLHDAGYDSYWYVESKGTLFNTHTSHGWCLFSCRYSTGVAFHGLAAEIHEHTRYPLDACVPDFALWDCSCEDKEIRWYYGRNKLYFHLSPYSIDLESPHSDPLARGMSECSTYRVTGINQSVTTRDIVRALTGLNDASGQTVNFEIVWVNDVCFVVGVMLSSRDNLLYQEHGEIVLKALKRRFQGACIQTFLSQNATIFCRPNIWNMWGVFSRNKRAQNENECGTEMKRQRLNWRLSPNCDLKKLIQRGGVCFALQKITALWCILTQNSGNCFILRRRVSLGFPEHYFSAIEKIAKLLFSVQCVRYCAQNACFNTLSIWKFLFIIVSNYSTIVN